MGGNFPSLQDTTKSSTKQNQSNVSCWGIPITTPQTTPKSKPTSKSISATPSTPIETEKNRESNTTNNNNNDNSNNNRSNKKGKSKKNQMVPFDLLSNQRYFILFILFFNELLNYLLIN